MKTKPEEIIGMNDVLIIPGQGMPVYDEPGVRGRLFVKVEVELPKKIWLEGDEIKTLESLLAKDPTIKKLAASGKPKNSTHVCTMSKGDISSFGRFGVIGREQDDDDDDYGRGSNPFAQYFTFH